jgi:hypothetical protein
MMNDELSSRNLFGLCILAAAIVLGLFLVFRQIVSLQRARVEASVKLTQGAPTPAPLSADKALALKGEKKMIVEVQREIEEQDKLEAYEKEERRPGLIQVFRIGQQLPQKKVEGVEFVKNVLFRSQVGTGRVLADVALMNDTGVPVTPRFQLILFNAKGKFLCRDTVLYITEELAPGDKKVETMSLAHGPTGVAYYEFRKLD